MVVGEPAIIVGIGVIRFYPDCFGTANQLVAIPIIRAAGIASAANRSLVIELPRFTLYQVVENI
jgi:hypothetical protein